jgi:hypothetical protein
MVSKQSCISTTKWSIEVYSHLRVAFGHPFLAVGGLKEALGAPVREHITPLNPSGHLPVARGGHSCSPPREMRAHTINRAHGAGE